MTKVKFQITCVLLVISIVTKATSVEYKIPRETDATRADRLAWWQHDRFGMFIHLGLYSLAGRHEWVKSLEAISDAEYDRKYFANFNPKRLDARKWAKSAKAAGMKYAVLTTKHHEGFCLWDSKVTDYKSTNTPFGRDVVREFVDAFRAEGIRVGFYYSLIDWHHPDYTVDLVNHPQKGLSWELYKQFCDQGKPKETLKPYLDKIAKLNEGRDMTRYRQYMRDQLTELLTDYGKIDILWFDFSFSRYFTGKGRADWDSEGILTLVRKLQPGIIVNCRLDLLDDPCGYDFLTPEQVNLGAAPVMNGKKVAWETCQTLSGSWGYFRDEHTWKSSAQIIGQLSRTVALGGNLIMNVGPTGRGEFDARALERLGAYAKWMNANGEAVYGCTAAPSEFETPQGTALTWNPTTRRLYIHILEWPTKTLPVRFWNRIAYAQFLHDASEVKVAAPNWIRSMNGDDRASVTGMLQLPVLKPDVEVPVVEVQLKEDGDLIEPEIKEAMKLVP